MSSKKTNRESLEQSVHLLETTRTRELQLARSARSSQIGVVTGAHDRVQELLDAAEIPYTLCGSFSEALEKSPTTVFLNCGGEHPNPICVQEYVKNGNRIVSTDWALDVVIETFPGYVVKGSVSVPESTFAMQPVGSLGERLLGSSVVKRNPHWWFEGASYTVFDAKKQGHPIIPLLASEVFAKKYDTNLVAFGIQHGKGEVVHFCSHLYAQKIAKKEGVATDYTALHAVLMLCGRAPVLWDPASGDPLKSVTTYTSSTSSKKSAGLL